MQAAARVQVPVKPAVAKPVNGSGEQLAPVQRTEGPGRSNVTLPLVKAALEAKGGATLAELTQVAGWRAPFELANLRIACMTFAHDGAAGAGRRYRIATAS
jgi:hypothetical protein